MENGNLMELMGWAYNLGKHESELRRLRGLCAEWVDQYYGDGTKTAEGELIVEIFNSLGYIAVDMRP